MLPTSDEYAVSYRLLSWPIISFLGPSYPFSAHRILSWHHPNLCWPILSFLGPWYPFLAHPIPSRPILSFPGPSYPFMVHPMLPWPTLGLTGPSHPLLAHPILCWPIQCFPGPSHASLAHPILSEMAMNPNGFQPTSKPPDIPPRNVWQSWDLPVVFLI